LGTRSGKGLTTPRRSGLWRQRGNPRRHAPRPSLSVRHHLPCVRRLWAGRGCDIAAWRWASRTELSAKQDRVDVFLRPISSLDPVLQLLLTLSFRHDLARRALFSLHSLVEGKLQRTRLLGTRHRMTACGLVRRPISDESWSRSRPWLAPPFDSRGLLKA